MDIAIPDLGVFHDAELVQLNICREEKSVRLEYLSSANIKLMIQASGVLAFRAVDIATQNVVSRILLAGAHGFSDADIKEKLQWVSACVDSPSYFSRDTAENYLARVRSSEVSLLVIESSIGAESCLLCEKVSFSSIAPAK